MTNDPKVTAASGEPASLPAPEIRVGLADLEPQLAEDVWRSVERGIAASAALEDAGDPEEVFRATIQRSVRAIAREGRASMLRRYLVAGPYSDSGEIPPERAGEFQSDVDVAATIRFIHSSVISRFQGALAELLAIGPLCQMATNVFGEKAPRLFAGDTVRAQIARGGRLAKGADFHLLEERHEAGRDHFVLRGVAEVKSYSLAHQKLMHQLDRHLARAQRGLEVMGRAIPRESLEVGEPDRPPLRVLVVPADWKLPRGFRFQTDGERKYFVPDPLLPPAPGDEIQTLGARDGRVVLRWSQEALAAEAYGITFRYLSDVASELYQYQRPAGWESLSPEEAGEEAVKMMPYYAILRAPTRDASSRAIALYNSYGFGYAIGAKFVDQKGRREMLWFEDLEEITEKGFALREEQVVEPRDGTERRVIPAQRCRIR